MTAADAPPLPSPWGELALDGDGAVTDDIGPLRIWARARAGEVWLAHAPGSGGRGADDAGPPDPPEEEDWTRWPVPEGTTAVRTAPVFPPRTVVAEPERSFRLLPRSRARVFVRVPLWARIHAGSRDAPVLTEVPTVVLSDTWWGSFTEGELCYWLSTTARRQVSPDVFSPHLAVCPLLLSNGSDEELPVEKIAVRVAHLSLFSDEGRFWADETRVRYRGGDEGSEIRVTGERPDEAGEAARVAPPRETPPSRGFRGRTFARLKSLPGMAGF